MTPPTTKTSSGPLATLSGRLGGLGGLLLGNVGARVGALGSLGVATLMAGYWGGPGAVGALMLLRMLPGVFTILASGGQQAGIPYHLAGSDFPAERVKPTLAWLTVLGSLTGGVLWLVFTPLWLIWFQADKGADLGLGIVIACAIPVITQLYVANTRALLQGMNDIRGGNGALFFEEFAFLPIYGVMISFDPGAVGILVSLVLADIVVAAGSAVRLRAVGYFSGWGRPDGKIGRSVVRYGLRAEVGNLFHWFNGRLDQLILGALLGPVMLGVYGIASKVAELLRVIGLTGPQVLYPVFAKEGRAAATRKARRMLLPFLGLNVAAAIPLAAAVPLIPLILPDPRWQLAVIPAWILIGGLLFEGVTGLIMGYFLGVGRPGLTSLSLGIGLGAVAVLQYLMISVFGFGINGAAVATGIGYLVTTSLLVTWFARVSRSITAQEATT